MAVVVALFEKRLEGFGVQELAAWTRATGVTSKGHDPRAPRRGLSHTRIYRILSNDFYVTGERIFKVTQSGWPIEVIWQRVALPRYVDPKVFDQVAAMRKRRYGERQAAGSYLLGGLVYHRTSGTPFTSSSTKTASGQYCYYTNREWAAARRRLRAQRAALACSQPRRSRPIRASLRKEELEGVVLAQLARAAENRRLLRKMLEVDRAKEVPSGSPTCENRKSGGRQKPRPIACSTPLPLTFST